MVFKNTPSATNFALFWNGRLNFLVMRESQAFGSLPETAGLDRVKNATEVSIDNHDRKALSCAHLFCVCHRVGKGTVPCVEG